MLKKVYTVLLVICLLMTAAVVVIDLTADSGLTPVAEPRSGEILSGKKYTGNSEITIKASGSESCAVKLKTNSGAERLCFYVRAGDTVTVSVPKEYLYVYFASGSTWYGEEHLFGERTSYQKTPGTKDFVNYTWEFTLYKVSDGNLTLDTIDKDDF